jgi:hypothetical protein
MTNDFAARYSLKELLDLVTFLKSGGGSSSTEVSIKDLF